MDCTICHFEIPVNDPKKAKAFYEGLFGWEVVAAPEEDPGYMLVATSSRKGSLGGGLSRRTDKQKVPVIYILVDSLDQTITNARELGGRLLTGKVALPTMGWVATLEDTQGNVIGVFEKDEEAG